MSRPGPKQKVRDEEIVETILHVQSRERVASTADIESSVDLTPERIRERCKKLQSDGIVKSKQIGNNTAWWVAIE